MNKFLFLVPAALLLATANAGTAAFKIIANASVPAEAISAEDLRAVFLETKALLDGIHPEPVLQRSGAVHESFLKAYVGKSDSALENYYRSLVFTGKGSMPKYLGSDADVVAHVARTKGAIGYVNASASTPGVKTLEVK
jgi:ABC-type phosphate transport system substrate-binding protein